MVSRLLVLLVVLAGCGEPVAEGPGRDVDLGASPPARSGVLQHRFRHAGPTARGPAAWEIVAYADSLLDTDAAAAAHQALNVYLSSAPPEARYEAFRIMAAGESAVARRWIRLVVEGRQDAGWFGRLRPVEPAMDDTLRHDYLARQAAVPPIEQLAWLVGRWERRDGELVVREEWLPAGGGVMHGVSRTWRAGRLVGWEELRIGILGEEVVYTARPSGQAPADLRGAARTRIRPGFLLVERDARDFPARLQYVHTGIDGDLRVTAAGREGDRGRSVDWLYRRVTDLEAP